MSEPNVYPCATITEMAAIPEEALPRFLAELPELLAEVRNMRALFANTPLGELADMEVDGAKWIDDNAQTTTINTTFQGFEDEAMITVVRKFGDK